MQLWCGIASLAASVSFLLMKRLFVLASALFSLSCHISPVVTADDLCSDQGWTRRNDSQYESCQRAARDFCKYALDTPESQMNSCVAQRAYECTSGSSSSPRPR